MGESVYSDNRWMPPTKRVGIWGAPLPCFLSLRRLENVQRMW